MSANPGLKAETSKNFDLGIVISPTADSNLSLDFYKISIDNVIATQNTAYNISTDPASYPGQVHYAADGSITYVTIPYENQYRIMTSGLDFEVSQAFHLTNGSKLSFDFKGTYVSSMSVDIGGGQSTDEASARMAGCTIHRSAAAVRFRVCATRSP